MRLVSVERVKPGDVLGQSILGIDGCLMLKEGVTLTENYIGKLISMGIIYLYIKDRNLEDIKPEDPKFIEFKSEVVKSLKTVFSKLQYNDNISIKNTLTAITEIVEYLIDNKEIDSSYLLELKTFDNYTYIHSLNTCVLALFFGIQMGYSKAMLIDLGVGAMLHDIGKTRIPVEVLNKRGKLTLEEYNIIKKHPEIGYCILENVKDISDRSKLIVLEHHERIDGKGYPNNLLKEEIHKFSKITCISDVYDAIVSDRVYRKGYAANEAYEFILGGGGNFFDINLVEVFRENFSIYPLGACLLLSNGIEGFVIGHNKGFPDRPIIRILYDDMGNKISPMEINLVEKIDIGVKHIII